MYTFYRCTCTRFQVQLDHGRGGARSEASCPPSEISGTQIHVQLMATMSIPQARKGEAAKYEQRVREDELGSFTRLIFSTSGGMAKSTAVAYKRLASLLANKRDQPYSVIMAWQCTLPPQLLTPEVRNYLPPGENAQRQLRHQLLNRPCSV